MTWTNSSRQDLPSRSSRFISTSSTTTSPIVGHGVGKRWRKRSRISLNDKNHNIYNKKGKGLATRRSRGGRHTCYNGIYNSNNFSKIGSITNITNINNNNSCIKNINNITTGNINSNNRCCIRKKSNNNCSSGINNNNNNNNNNKSGSFVREHQRIRRVAAATRRVLNKLGSGKGFKPLTLNPEPGNRLKHCKRQSISGGKGPGPSQFQL